MKSKTCNTIIFICLLVTARYCPDSAIAKAEDPSPKAKLKIYLPRAVEVKKNVMNLGDICIIRGDKSLAAVASRVQMGRIAFAGQKVVVTKTMILSRLICDGIDASQITLSGAEKITTVLEHKTITSSDFFGKANEFMVKNPPAGQACQWAPTKMPKDFIIPGSPNDIELSVFTPKISSRNHVKVQIDVIADGKKIGKREILYRLQYKCRSVVANTDIPVGGIIRPENVRIEEFIANTPEKPNWSIPYGLVAKRKLLANKRIHPNMVGSPKPEIAVKRNQTVLVKIDTGGILATAGGVAMQDGCIGEFIRVKMQITKGSQRVIFAKVKEDGTLEPVF
ncbi:MAG: flagellar basal body P-ring formation chaperone FlgA [Planctomycetota bacterium]